MTRERRNKPLYPWAEWTNGVEHLIHYGDDFTVEPSIMVIQLHNKARRLDVYLATALEGSSIRFRYVDTASELETYLAGRKRHVQRAEAPTAPKEMTLCNVCGETLKPHEYGVGECTGTANASELMKALKKLGAIPKVHDVESR